MSSNETARKFLCTFKLELYNPWPVADVAAQMEETLKAQFGGSRVNYIEVRPLDVRRGAQNERKKA